MVLDNCMGSGTTNLACIKLNRKSIGIEKEKQYYDVAVRRLWSIATNGSAMSSGGIRTTHYQNITNDNRKHKLTK